MGSVTIWAVQVVLNFKRIPVEQTKVRKPVDLILKATNSKNFLATVSFEII